MSSPLRRVLGVAVAAAAALLLSIASAAPLRLHDDAEARLRVAFSARPERIERCRTLSDSELAGVPVHMRQPVVCEGYTARYRLDVRRDDSLLFSAVLRGGGLRHDRRLYVLREQSLPAGRSAIDLRLTRLDASNRPDTLPPPDAPEDDHGRRAHEDDPEHESAAQRDEDERRRRVADEVPAVLALRDTITLEPREVVLVTYDQSARRFHVVRGGR
jgi:hypothetical protein